MTSSSSSSYRIFSLDEIKEATNHFDMNKCIHQDSDGLVYQGKIYDYMSGNGRTENVCVAVKRFATKFSNGMFEKEVEIYKKIQHPNIASLLGFCVESGEKALVYENFKKGRLQDYVKERSTFYLSWKQRLNICLGAAYGLQHLHKETPDFPKGIIHRNVKPSNIFLDENWVAKVFGLGLSHVSQTISSQETSLSGTMGYLSPEYIRSNHLTKKVDVFAFGVVLFEVLCLNNPWNILSDEDVNYNRDEPIGGFGVLAQKNVDIRIDAGISDDSLMAFTNAIGRCLQYDPYRRPTMDRVVQYLKTAIECQEGEGEPLLFIHTSTPRKSRDFGGMTQSGASSSSYVPFCLSSASCRRFSLAEIKESTDSFNEEKVIGRGGEGKVYLAEICLNSEIEKTRVAVKQLEKKSTQFEKEIQTVSKIKHDNIVSLLGYCNEYDEKILIYEYMANQSLSYYVRKDSETCLTWKQRLNICLGAAYGLQHLHKETKESPKGIIHRDVKPGNILLDHNWVAKVSDFGMLKVSESTQTKSTMMSKYVRGTDGYLAPEYNSTKKFTRKIDVYAFGMVMFEVLCRKSRWGDGDESIYIEEDEDLQLWVKESVDVEIKDQISYHCLDVLIDIIVACLQYDPNKRPTMDEVVLHLETAQEFQSQNQ